MIPDELGYSDQHEWVRVKGDSEGLIVVGITDYAQGALGDIVFVQLPEVGAVVVAGDVVGEVESTKSVSEIFTPLAGTVVAVNDNLESSPELVNSDPYSEGWIFEMELADPSSVDSLLDADGYAEVIGEN